jgi:hypothetical protein
MSTDDQIKVVETLEILEQDFGFYVPAGRNSSLQFMAHLWEPLRVIHKPLILHLVSEASLVFSHAFLSFMGFHKSHIGGFNYWIKNAPSQADTDTAV